MRPPAELTAAFRERGLKVTPQRQLLFRLMHENTTHPTADALFVRAAELMPGISLRTVYQTLNDLTAMGELQTARVDAGPTRFDPNVDRHHHLRCERCGELRDVYVDGLDRLRIDGLAGFDVTGAAVVFSGTCAQCAGAGATPG
ncbi:MAG: transcriptional repressor [Ilumatobacteraceae bacterium]